MTAFLPPNLLALFAARDPIPYLQPTDKPGHEKRRVPYSGVAQCLKDFEDPKDTPPPTRVETKDERKERKRKERAEQIAYKLEQDLALWNPHGSTGTASDPFKSLFVARVNYDTSESKLRREFEVYGPVRKINLICDKFSGKPRGYAFIEYEHERDMHSAYKHADGKKIDGRRVLVDVERGRTVKGWRPRRLGGGLGGTRKGGPDECTRFSGRDDYSRDGYRDRSGSRERDRDRTKRRSRSPRERRRSRSPRERRRSRSPRERKDKRRRSRSPRDNRKRSRSRDRKRERGERDRPDRDRKRDRREEEGAPMAGGDAENFGDGEFANMKQEPNMEDQQQENGNAEGYNNYEEYVPQPPAPEDY